LCFRPLRGGQRWRDEGWKYVFALLIVVDQCETTFVCMEGET
jgi:hypothetical protein